MNEDRPIGLLPTRWDRGLLAMVVWSLVLHVAAAVGVLAVVPWAGARASRAVPSYTVELTSLGAVGGSPGGKPESGRVSPSPGGRGDNRPKPKEATAVPKPPETPTASAGETPKATTKKAAKANEAETPKKSEEAPKKPPSVNKAESEKGKEPAEKVVKPTEALAVSKEKPETAAAVKDPAKEKSAPPKEVSKPKPAPESDAAKEAKEVQAPDGSNAGSKPTVQNEAVRAETKVEGATKTVPEDGGGQGAEDDEGLLDDPRYAQAIEGIRRRVEQGGTGPGDNGGGQVATTGGGSGIGGGNRVVGTEFLIYYNIMISHIKQAWVWVGHDQSLSVTVHFAIEADGEIRDIRLDRPSGDPSYDQSVLEAVRKVNPLPPPPAAYTRDFRHVELTFRPGDLREAG